jgi:hypothetical protein
MSELTEQVRTLKAVFEKAKHTPRRESGRLTDLDLHGELQHALCVVGDKKLFELKDEIYPYLKDQFSEFREEAVRTLGSCNGLQLDEFRDVAYDIWLNDPNENVKVAALNAWTGYYDGAKNPIILKNLYTIFRNEQYAIRIRVYALYGFMDVADAFSYLAEPSEILFLTELEDQKELNKAIDWGKMNRLMQQYVPGWKKK